MPSEAWEGFRSKLSPHEGAVGSQLPPGPCNCTVQEISHIPWETVRGGLANGRGTGQAMIQGGGREERLADPVEIKVLWYWSRTLYRASLSLFWLKQVGKSYIVLVQPPSLICKHPLASEVCVGVRRALPPWTPTPNVSKTQDVLVKESGRASFSDS